jgi:hypothetical protein
MYGNRLHQIEPIHSYMFALEREAEIKPIRGMSPECKPLGLRRNKHINIRKAADESVVCRLYNTDILTYHKDGRIVVDLDGWASDTTVKILSMITGEVFCRFDNRIWLAGSINNDGVAASYAILTNEPNVLRRSTRGGLVPENPVPVVTHNINRKEANNVRSMYKDFRNYLVASMRLRDNGFSREELLEAARDGLSEIDMAKPYKVRAYYKPPADMMDKFFDLVTSGDTTKYYAASLLVVMASTATLYGYNLKPTEAEVLKSLDDLLFLKHRDTVFRETLCTEGNVMCKDLYARFF